MKRHHLLGGLLAAAIVAVPTTALAGQQYTPLNDTDAASDAGTPSNANLDIVAVKATRTGDVFSVAVTYTGVPKTTRARYSVTFDGLGNLRVLELAYRPDGTSKINGYTNSTNRAGKGGLPSLRRDECPGSSVVLNQSAKKLRFVLPADCYAGDSLGGTYLDVDAGRWTAETFSGSNPTNEDAAEPNKSDNYGGFWGYRGRS